ncbi:MAG: hypothetical protein ACRDBP_08675, partial [Luteolibacter sp.]
MEIHAGLFIQSGLIFQSKNSVSSFVSRIVSEGEMRRSHSFHKPVTLAAHGEDVAGRVGEAFDFLA